jgi:site-specific DNA-methyltransferase (adenine-specific)
MTHRVHEPVSHWYRGRWSGVYRDVPTIPGQPRPTVAIKARGRTPHTGVIGTGGYEYGATRLARSVLRVKSMHRRAIHPTEKPVDLLDALIRYGCPPGGLVIDPCAGSGSTGAAARAAGRRALLVEADEAICEAAARRLADPHQLGLDA